ncbi:SpiroCoCo family coiled-coil protein [Brachyspira pilosicoli]
MFPILNFALMLIIPIIVVGISKIIDRKKNNNNSNYDDIFAEEKAALEGIIEEKISEVRDNAIDLEIAVKKAGFISKSMEEDLAKLNNKIESYKDYKAAVSQYQEQVDSLEEAYLDILNKVDTVLKERNTIEKTYKRISDVKTKMIELEKNVSSIQDNLIASYNAKLNDFESELYKRFDALTTNLLARDAHYTDMAEQEKDKISALTEEFKLHVAKKEELFTNQLTQLAERTARNNIEQLAELFEKGRDELINKYSLFAEEINSKSKDIEERYASLSQSKEGLEVELINLRDTIQERLNSITESSVEEFKGEMEKTKEFLYNTLKEELEKIGNEKEEFLESVEDKAHSLEKTIDDIKDKAELITKDYEDKTVQLETEFTTLKNDISNRLITEVEAFSNNIRDILENENDGVITLYRNKTKELSDLIVSIDGMSEETMLRAESKFDEIVNDIERLKNDILARTQDDMEYSIDNARSSLIAEINELRADVETETNILKDKMNEIHYQTSEISSILTNKQEEILDALSLEKEYLYKDLEEQANKKIQELEDNFNNIKSDFEIGVDNYIKNTYTDLNNVTEKLSVLKEQYDNDSNKIQDLLKDTEINLKENIEKRIELLDKTSSEIKDLVDSANEKLDTGIKNAESNIEEIRNNLYEYGNSYLDSLKSQLKEVLDNYEETSMKSISDSINSLVHQVEESDKRHNDIVSNMEDSLKEFKDKIDYSLNENKEFAEDNKNKIVNMLNTELLEATNSFDALLNEKREGINKVRDDIEDILNKVENGREDFENTINRVYDVAN